MVRIKEAFVVEALEMEVLNTALSALTRHSRAMRPQTLSDESYLFPEQLSMLSVYTLDASALYDFTRWVLILCKFYFLLINPVVTECQSDSVYPLRLLDKARRQGPGRQAGLPHSTKGNEPHCQLLSDQ